MASSVIRVLERKHAALTRLLIEAERLATQRRLDVEHMAATIRLLTADPQPANRRPGAISRVLMTILREDGRPLPGREVVMQYVARTGEPYPRNGIARRQALDQSIHRSLSALRGRGVLSTIPGPGEPLWAINADRSRAIAADVGNIPE